MKTLFNRKTCCVIALFSTHSIIAQNQLELILDGYAYQVNSDIVYNINNNTLSIAESDATDCMRPGDLLPLNSAGSMTLLTNSQSIGISRTRYLVEGNLLFLTSETSNLICNNGVFIDQIFVDDFD